ncbi:MAG: LuxR C-terminal-related transcriptional regulator, partial [Cycloclasticus sp.]
VMVYQGKSYLSSAVASNLLFSAQKPDENVFTRLSSRELQIISKIVDGHAISDIADALAISPKTVNTHRYRAHEKLGVSNDVELVRLAVDTGQLKNI